MRIFHLLAIAVISMSVSKAPAMAAGLEIDVRFSSKEISVILGFYKSTEKFKSQGKKGAKRLPPGIAKNLGRGKPLPPGIAKKTLPSNLILQLPPVADGYERIVVAGKILLVEVATQIIHDILVDAVFD